jgi:hypothetical protein
MIVRAFPRLGLAVVLVTSLVTSASGCASDLDEGVVASPMDRQPPPVRMTRTQIYDRDRALVAGVATSLALGIVGLGTLLASGIYATPGNSEPHAVPPAMLIAGGVMSAGFLTTVPFAIAVERHRARHPTYFPNQRGRTRVPPPRTPSPSLGPPPLSLRARPAPVPLPGL